MNFRDWYTDTMDVFRVTAVRSGALTRQEREQVEAGIPCRLYHLDASRINMSQTAASTEDGDWVQCGNEADIRPGDELIIRRGARLGKAVAALRAFAAEPNHYFEPFGAVLPGLAHQEVRLLHQERVK